MEEQERQTVEMTAEEREQFEAFKASKMKKDAEERAKNEREQYRAMVDAEVKNTIPGLREISKMLAKAKEKVFKDFGAILDMKSEVMKLTKDNQRTHTFTDSEGRCRVTLGVYMLDAYDDTVEDGIEMVKEYLTGLANDEDTKALVEMVLRLMSKDAQGSLKASRVLQLRKLASDSKNERFIEGVRIIEESYRPVPSKTFVRAEEKDENGGWKVIPLGMTES